MVINGEWIESATENFDNVYNPATGEVIAKVPLSTKEEFDQASKLAHEAFQMWGKESTPKRGRYFFKLHQLLVENYERKEERLKKLGKSY